MKNQDEAGGPYGGNMIRELVLVRSPVAIFLDVQVPVRRLGDRNQVVELPYFRAAQQARAIYALMLNDLRSSEPINIADELLDPLSGLCQHIGQWTCRFWRDWGSDPVNILGKPAIGLRPRITRRR